VCPGPGSGHLSVLDAGRGAVVRGDLSLGRWLISGWCSYILRVSAPAIVVPGSGGLIETSSDYVRSMVLGAGSTHACPPQPRQALSASGGRPQIGRKRLSRRLTAPDVQVTAAGDRSSGEPRLAFGVHQVAQALGISRKLVAHMILTGELQTAKPGHRRPNSDKAMQDPRTQAASPPAKRGTLRAA
jgi:hypothetical protein